MIVPPPVPPARRRRRPAPPPRRAWLIGALVLAGLIVGFLGTKALQPTGSAAPPLPLIRRPPAETSPAPQPSSPRRIASRSDIWPFARSFDTDRAMEHIRVLSEDIGKRFGGSPEEREASEYLTDRFSSWGYEASLQDSIPMPPSKKLTQNVIARMPPPDGRPRPPLTLYIGAHYDSIYKGGGSPGANDNGTGVGAMLEIARLMAPLEWPFEVVFVGFGCEECIDADRDHHHYGSRHFARQLKQQGEVELQRSRLINIDMVGVGSDLQLRAMGPGGTSMLERAVKSGKALSVKFRRRVGGSGSDHEAFERVGVPSVWLYRAKDPDYHTSRDRYENISPTCVQIAGRLVLHMIATLALEEQTP